MMLLSLILLIDIEYPARRKLMNQRAYSLSLVLASKFGIHDEGRHPKPHIW